MICRLCLVNTNVGKCVPLYNKVKSDVDFDVVKIIERYLRLQIKQEDAISTSICTKCCKHLSEFHQFCAYVEQQQETLHNQLPSRTEEDNVSDHDNNEFVSSNCISPVLDPLELQLKCEPEDPDIIAETVNTPTNDEYSMHDSNTENSGCRNRQSSVKLFSSDQNLLKRKSSDIVAENKTIRKQLLNIEQSLLQQSAAFTKHTENFQKSFYQQNAVIKKQTELLEILLEKFPLKTNFDIFPFKHIRELEEFEKSFNKYDEADLIQYIKNWVGKSSISKCMHLIFDSECLLEVNWDGKYNKIPVKNTHLFSKLLFEAVKNEEYGFTQFEKDVKKGFRFAKNRQYRHKLLQKKPDF